MEIRFLQLAILIMSVVIHEVCHGFAALMLGDHTAKMAGRLTLNPIKHLDPVGSVMLPLFLIIIQSPFLFGWAKPVPYNPYNLKNQKYGSAIVGLAGPGANIAIALVFGLALRFSGMFDAGSPVFSAFLEVFSIIVFINLLLAIFNLIPIPPLDGSKILFAVLPSHMQNIRYTLERYGFILLIFFIFFLFKFIFPVIVFFHFLITGRSI